MASSRPTHSASSAPQYIDDKSPLCIPFILSHLEAHQKQHPDKPFFIGLNGVQGAGKTTLVSKLQEALQRKGLETLVCSIDDLYLTHDDQLALAKDHVDNALVQHRGEPGTHDMQIAQELFAALITRSPTNIPSYDKSLYSGSGDRLTSSQWLPVNQSTQPKVEVIIFEGWCVGFRALSPSDLEAKYHTAAQDPSSTLSKHKLEHLHFVNAKLKDYDVMTDCFHVFIHIDAKETGYVYEWRLEQEAALRMEKGTAMTDEQVVNFVDGYYPAYELYTAGLRKGVLKGEGKQLRLMVGRDRRVIESMRI